MKGEQGAVAGYEELVGIHLEENKPRDALMALDQAAKTRDASAEFLINLGGFYANLERRAPLLKGTINSNGLAVLNPAVEMKTTDPPCQKKLADDVNLVEHHTHTAKLFKQLPQSENRITVLTGDPL